MPLNKDENELFEHSCYEKQAPIDEKYRAELRRIDGIADINKHPQYLKAIKEYAREILNVRVSTYIETFKQVGRYPSEEDFETFGQELKGIAVRFKDIFAKRYNRPLSYPYPKEWIDKVLDQLSMELEQANGFALVPLRRFISEGKVKENQRKEAQKGEQLYDKIKSLIQDTKPLDQKTAKLIIELADDAIKEFGSDSQEKRVELRDWKARAALVIPPSDFEEARKRGEGHILKKFNFKNYKLRNGLLALLALIVFIVAILVAKESIFGGKQTTQATPSPSPGLTPSPLPSLQIASSSNTSASRNVASPAEQQRSPEAQMPPLCIRDENSKSAFGGDITIAISGISYEGSPLRHFANVIINSPGYKPKEYPHQKNGDEMTYRGRGVFEITVLSTDTFSACFDIRRSEGRDSQGNANIKTPKHGVVISDQPRIVHQQ